jgi:hypothetical protein
MKTPGAFNLAGAYFEMKNLSIWWRSHLPCDFSIVSSFLLCLSHRRILCAISHTVLWLLEKKN